MSGVGVVPYVGDAAGLYGDISWVVEIFECGLLRGVKCCIQVAVCGL